MNQKTTADTVLRIGDTVPDFSAETTSGPIKLSEFGRNHWVILFFHQKKGCMDGGQIFNTILKNFKPSDNNTKFLGVCTNGIFPGLHWEISGQPQYDVYNHIPIADDKDLTIVKMYGLEASVLPQDTFGETLFFIDTSGTLRCIMRCQLQSEEHMASVKRVLKALQCPKEEFTHVTIN